MQTRWHSALCDAFTLQNYRNAPTRIIELSGLSDTQATASNDQHFLHVHEIPRSGDCATVQVRLRIGRFLSLVSGNGRLCESAELATQNLLGSCDLSRTIAREPIASYKGALSYWPSYRRALANELWSLAD